MASHYRISAGLLAFAALAFCAWLLAEDQPAVDNAKGKGETTSVITAIKAPATPPIDRALPARIETATFAMG